MLKRILSENRSTILDKWQKLIVETYPPESAQFLTGERNRFKNPIGYTFVEGTKVVLNALIEDETDDRVVSALDDMVKLRAVQDFSAAHAVRFIFLLKEAIRGELGEQLSDDRLACELLSLETNIDHFALLAFDCYMRNREKIFDIRVKEIKDRSLTLTERMLRTHAVSEGQSKSDDNNVL
jgi:hypothetical protein